MPAYELLAAALSWILAGSPQGPLAPSPRPGLPSPDLEQFTLNPAGETSFRLLVVPVVFPGEDTLGNGGTEGITAKLSDLSPAGLTGYFASATYGRLKLEPLLAPAVRADHPRTFYTNEGEGNFGYGTDPGAYPHNARYLVEEVTTKLLQQVDFLYFDNTDDGITDGLLLLHSGPPAPETGEGITPDDMLAHAFTLEVPLVLGDGAIFPYAIASSFDPLGPWAHEVGHLFGLPDLYINNPLAPGEGVGEWSLMATGALAGGGQTPAGLDASSLLKLGFIPDTRPGMPLSVIAGDLVRAFSINAFGGEQYFLVARSNGDNGLWFPEYATQVYLVNEAVPDNRDPNNLHVELRALVCTRDESCNAALDDFTSPSLRDADGNGTGLRLEFQQDSVAIRYPGQDPYLSSLRLGTETGPGSRPIICSFANSTENTLSMEYGVQGLTAGWSVGAGRAALDVPPYSTATDSALYLAFGDSAVGEVSLDWWLIIPGGEIPRGSLECTLAPGYNGLPEQALPEFKPFSLSPGRKTPWVWSDTAWVGSDPVPFADGALDTPWFLVPENASLVLESSWLLDAVAPSTALDGGQVRLVRGHFPEVALQPPGGFGYEAERGTGNPLGGQELLSGFGDRVQIFPLSPYGGETVRLRFRLAGDAETSFGSWSLTTATVQASPECTVNLNVVPEGDVLSIHLAGAMEPCDVTFVLYGGRAPLVPSRVVAQGMLQPGTKILDTHVIPGRRMRYDVVWWADERARQSTGSGTPVVQTGGRLAFPFPNPLRMGEVQTWSVDIQEEGPLGMHWFKVTSVTGRLVYSQSAEFLEPGRRRITWNGLDSSGRSVAAGNYWLTVSSPSGLLGTQRITVIP